MNKSDYISAVSKFGLGFFDWLKVLPFYGGDNKPVTLKHAVPIVHYPISERAKIEARIKAGGFHFAPSTLHYVAGYHIPEGHEMRAFVKDN